MIEPTIIECACWPVTGGHLALNPKCALHGERVSRYRLTNGAEVQVMQHAPFCPSAFVDRDGNRAGPSLCDCLRELRP